MGLSLETVVMVFGAVVAGGSYYLQQYLPPPKPHIVGIDLGTTYSVIGVYHAGSGEVEIIADEHGRRTIPSVVAFTPNGTLVGGNAKAQGQSNPVNTIFDAKRFMGKPLSDELLAEATKRYPFKVVGRDGALHFVVGGQDGVPEQAHSPEAIGSMIIATLKRSAEAQLRVDVLPTELVPRLMHYARRKPKPLRHAVIAVPAEFNEAQRNATVVAARLAGLEVLRVINEPTAAAMAYGVKEERAVEGGLIIVFDFGGGTLDVSLLGLQAGTFITMAISGNAKLGGEDFTHKLHEVAMKKCEATSLKGARASPMVRQRLRLAAEQVKLALSTQEEALISVALGEAGDEEGAGERFEMRVTRREFEEMNSGLFDKVLVPVQKVLESIKMPPTSVSDVVLVGGSTRIPRVRELLTKFFGRTPNTGINPDEAIAIGVSIQAGIMGGAWPLQVAATEIVHESLRKIDVTDEDD